MLSAYSKNSYVTSVYEVRQSLPEFNYRISKWNHELLFRIEKATQTNPSLLGRILQVNRIIQMVKFIKNINQKKHQR